MVFATAASIFGVKKSLSPTQTQTIGYTNNPSDLQLEHHFCVEKKNISKSDS